MDYSLLEGAPPGPWWVDDDGLVASGHGDTYQKIAEIILPIVDDTAPYQGIALAIAALPDLIEENKRLREALDKTLSLVSKGAAEGAYNNMVAGPEYAERVFQQARAALKGESRLTVKPHKETIMNKFEGMTPGPWSIVGNEHAHTVVSDDIVIADVFTPDDDTVSPQSEEEALANAEAIAALPDLIEENKRLRELLNRALSESARVHPDFAKDIRNALKGE